MPLLGYIITYWDNSYFKKYLVILKKFSIQFLYFPLLEYQIFKSSRFIKALSSAYRFRISRNNNFNLLLSFFWILVIISASFSFKIFIDNIGNESLFIKFDDIALIFLMLFSLIKIKEWKTTSLDLPIIIFILFCIISIFRGILINSIPSLSISILYLLKIIHYLLLFYFMFNFLNKKEDALFYLRIVFITAVLIGIYGIIEHFYRYPYYPFTYPFFYRIYERGYFYYEAKHFATYLMFISSLIFGLLVFNNKDLLKKVGLIAVFLLLCIPLFWTYSRSTYIALVLSLLVISGMRSKKVFTITAILFLLFLLFLPPSIKDRIYSIKTALLSDNPYSSSFAYRVQYMRYAFETIKQYPLLGIGLAARNRVFYENQFIMFISEIGLLGLLPFMSIILIILKTAISLYKSAEDKLIKGFSAGYIGGLFGLLFESNALVVFLVSRIMIPFWIITAIMFWLYKENSRKKYEKSNS